MSKRSTFEGGGLSEGEERFQANAKTDVEYVADAVLHEEASELMTEREARKLFGKQFFGPREIEKTFGHAPESVPPIPFTLGELRHAHERGDMLVFCAESLPDGKGGTWDLTLQNLCAFAYPAMGGMSRQDMNRAWFSNVGFFVEDMPRPGWRLVGEGPDEPSQAALVSVVKRYFEQTADLAERLRHEDGQDGYVLPEAYRQALEEFETKRGLIHSRILAKEKDAVPLLVGLRLNALMRERPVEVVYRELLVAASGKKGFLERGNAGVSTNTQVLGELLSVKRDNFARFTIEDYGFHDSVLSLPKLNPVRGIFE